MSSASTTSSPGRSRFLIGAAAILALVGVGPVEASPPSAAPQDQLLALFGEKIANQPFRYGRTGYLAHSIDETQFNLWFANGANITSPNGFTPRGPQTYSGNIVADPDTGAATTVTSLYQYVTAVFQPSGVNGVGNLATHFNFTDKQTATFTNSLQTLAYTYDERETLGAGATATAGQWTANISIAGSITEQPRGGAAVGSVSLSMKQFTETTSQTAAWSPTGNSDIKTLSIVWPFVMSKNTGLSALADSLGVIYTATVRCELTQDLYALVESPTNCSADIMGAGAKVGTLRLTEFGVTGVDAVEYVTIFNAAGQRVYTNVPPPSIPPGSDLTPPIDTHFSLTTLTGKTQTLQSYAGKVTYVGFCNTDCEPCYDFIPTLVQVQSDTGSRYNIVEAYVADFPGPLDTVDSINEFTSTTPNGALINYPILYSPSVANATLVMQDYQVNAIPISYVFDPAGNLCTWGYFNAMTAPEIEALLATAAKGCR